MSKFHLEPIYSRLGDEESRFLFEKRLCYSLTGDTRKMLHDINIRNADYKRMLNPKNEIFIFGSGKNGHFAFNNFPKITFRAFIDNDKSKVGKPDVLPIISFEEFIKNHKNNENAMVFIPYIIWDLEITQQLVNNGFPKEHIIHLMPKNSIQYFDLPNLKTQKNEFFIDAGGFDGVSTKHFFKWYGGRGGGKALIFEPNPIQYDVCKDNMLSYSNVKIVDKGLWHKNETLKFHKAPNGSGASAIKYDGEDIIEAISLDEYLKDEKYPVTFIKMDIEGAELNALKGAERIIKEQRPKLAISIYHKPEDIWGIPSLLLDFVPDYKFYIRHYTFFDTDTILYALVE